MNSTVYVADEAGRLRRRRLTLERAIDAAYAHGDYIRAHALDDLLATLPHWRWLHAPYWRSLEEKLCPPSIISLPTTPVSD